jgi:hypothetical protein
MFPPEVSEKIVALGGRDLILEAGAGEAIAAEQLFMKDLHGLLSDEAIELKKRGLDIWVQNHPNQALSKVSEKLLLERPSVLAVTKELDRKIDLERLGGKLKVVAGEYFEDISNSRLGRPKLILDPIGVMSYTGRPSEVLRKYVSTLDEHGDIYLLMDESYRSVGLEARVDPVTQRKAFSVKPGSDSWKYHNFPRWTVDLTDGTSIGFLDWLKSLNGHGLEVQELLNTELYVEKSTEGIERRWHSVKIRKTGASVTIPELEIVGVDESFNPPSRRFKVK